MMDNSVIDVSLSTIWESWFLFKKRKKSSCQIEYFTYYLEANLYNLYHALQSGTWRHGPYRKFIVTDNKRREVLVADIKDRVVHRLVYEYLKQIYQDTFIFDVWSCRKNKGLVGAIERTQYFLKTYSYCFVWRSDIKKFFDSVDQQKLIDILFSSIWDVKARDILHQIILSHRIVTERESRYGGAGKGIPIGNLTSQIFANIYLHEFDTYVKTHLKPRAYLRYGDDFIIISDTQDTLRIIKEKSTQFLQEKLHLTINEKNSIIIKARHGLKFLGVRIFPGGRKLNKRNWKRIFNNVSRKNISSYKGLVKKHSNQKRIKYFNWKTGKDIVEIL